MANEVKITITDENRTGPGVNAAKKNVSELDKIIERSNATVQKSQSRFAGLGSSLASTNRMGEGASATIGKLAAGAAVAGAAFAGVNHVLNEGIAVGLRSANAQVALGENYGRLKTAAEEQAHALGMTTSEYEQAAGMTASLAKNMGFATDVAVEFGMMMPDLSTKLSVLSNGTRTAAETSDMMRAAIAGEFDPLQTLGINISAATVEQEAMNLQLANGKKFTDQQANALAVLNIVQKQTGDASKVMATEQGKAAMEAQKNAAEMRQAWQDLERAAVPVLSAVTQYAGDTLGAIVDLKDAFSGEKGLGGGFKTVLNAAVPFTNILDRTIGKTKEEGDAAKNASPSIEELAKKQKGGAQTAEQLAEAVEEATDKITELAEVALNASDAAMQWEESLDNADQALKDNGKTLDITTEKGRSNKKALDDIARAALDQAEAIREAGGSEKQFRGVLEQGRSALIRKARQFGATKKEAERYADQILGIPRSRSTDIKLNTQQALGQLAYLRGRIRALDGSYIQVRARAVLDDSAVRGIATGGVTGAASGRTIGRGLTWTGEHGPELVAMPPGSRVYSNPDSQRMVAESMQQAAPGGGVATVELVSDDAALLTLLRKLVRQNGGSAEVVFSQRRGVS